MTAAIGHAAVTFLRVAPALASFVTAYYLTEVLVGPVRDLLHPEWANLRFLLAHRAPWCAADAAGVLQPMPPASLFGPTSRARAVAAADGRCLGVGLTPLGWATLVGADAGAAADRMMPAEALLGPAVGQVGRDLAAAPSDKHRAALLDDWLLARAAAAPAPRADVTGLTALLDDPAIGTVRELADASGLTAVTLARVCRRVFGFTPKLLLRRQRFLRTLATVLEHRGRLSASLDPHYVDQSHFNRDFRVFMGEPPARYFGRFHPVLDAAATARRAALGASVQGLHVPPRDV